MAGPTFIAARFGTGSTVSPVAMPAGTVNGDLVLAFALQEDITSPIPTPAGWALLDQVKVQGPDFSVYFGAFWRRSDGSGWTQPDAVMLSAWRDASDPQAWHVQGFPSFAHPNVNDGITAPAGATLVFGARSDVVSGGIHPDPPTGYVSLPATAPPGFEDGRFAVLADLVGWAGGATGALSGDFESPTATALVSLGPGLQPPVNTVQPAVSGSPCVGTTLACSTGTWTNSPTSYTYQWYRNTGGGWTAIPGASGSTYATLSADIGAGILCNVTAANAAGSATVSSTQVTITAPPANTAIPTVTGMAYVGQTLTTDGGAWTYAPTSYGYQWLRDGAAIAGATGSAYVLTRADRGHKVSVTTTATNGCGSAAATSAQTPTIMGGNLTMLM